MSKIEPIPYFHPIEPVLRDTPQGSVIPLRLIRSSDFEDLSQRSGASFSRQIEQAGFTGKEKQICILRNEQGAVSEILAGNSGSIGIYTFAHIFEKLRSEFSADFHEDVSYQLDTILPEKEATLAATGWALASYRFDLLKKEKVKSPLPVLIWPENADRKRTTVMAESLCLIRTLINMPSNLLGTDELAEAAAHIARTHRASIQKIVDKQLLEQNFPMIYEVGKGSPRRPQLIDIQWGDDENPHITLVGKGVVFDTGGLDIKPPPFMLLMKKDMGGAAHVLALAHAIMSLNMPVHLRVLLSIAENSVDGNSFRPGDVINSRKGLSVEVADTDAEGRLVVADALTYACEGSKKPDLLVDFCTLTGSARAALGYDIPAYMTNNETILEKLKNIGAQVEDPVWPLPLHQPYLKEMNSPIADLSNIGSGKAGAIHGGLFLQQFTDPTVAWIHVDCYAWEQSGKPGRPAGGADTGMRAMLSLIEEKYAR